MTVERRAISVGGIVQGVGYRPFVHGLASRLHLQGSVRNHTGIVRIEVEGDRGSLDRFLDELTQHPPPLAHIDHVPEVHVGK
jgi:hydrogenase maturation protein HypF